MPRSALECVGELKEKVFLVFILILYFDHFI